MAKENKNQKSQGITVKKSEDFSEWYTQVIQKADLIEYTDVSGCIVYKPGSYQLWENIQNFMNAILKKRGVKNAYFPIFIPEKLLVKEKDHVEGFTPEVAWVTHGGQSELKEKLAVRPTSETIMYDAYSKWIRSHRDLPLLINQWNNVIRWEFKNPMPFIRGREFLWQEGHNVFASKEEVDKDTYEILKDVYAKTQTDLLALPGLLGQKSDKEKFAGADYTISIENFAPNGRAIQGCTSHCLGQNFSKSFDIKFLDKDEKKAYAWQNSWGLSTRTIGIMIMIHSDDKGLVLPPRIAPTKAVIVPILFDKTKESTLKKCEELKKALKDFDVIIDDREGYTPGFKFNEWEMKGIPLRIEVGPKDMEKGQVVIAKRNTGEKLFIKESELKSTVEKTLEDIHNEMFNAAEKSLKENIVEVSNKNEFKKAIDEKKMVFAPWCEETACEEEIKDAFGGVKSLNMPFDQKALENKKCASCGKDAKLMCYFGKSY
ncbi:proline--tRNA ligase [Candidatus Woesearchaeota archaeon]|nr:MAG: proline--tRNA ligase [Candidatus Woesearchaeota archaeon]